MPNDRYTVQRGDSLWGLFLTWLKHRLAERLDKPSETLPARLPPKEVRMQASAQHYLERTDERRMVRRAASRHRRVFFYEPRGLMGFRLFVADEFADYGDEGEPEG